MKNKIDELSFAFQALSAHTSVPWYSSGLFLLAPKILMVGKPLMPYWPPRALCWSASTAPTLTTPCRGSEGPQATFKHSGH